MKRSLSYVIILAMMVWLLQITGCAYFNTYYNVKKKFNEAERDYNSRRPAEQGSQQQGTPAQPGSGQPRPQQNVPTDKYRKVIETASKLLEYHPKSRWIDDALLLMGISYFRMGDLARAERKFTELITIFPNSKFVGDATIWKARALLEQGKHQDATDLLSRMAPELKERRQRGQAELLLAKTEMEAKHWDEAVVHFRIADELLGSGEERWEAAQLQGVCLFEQGKYAEAEDAFSRVARNSRVLRRAYDAHIYTARSAVALGDAARAEKILMRLKDMSAFGELTGDVDLELAQLAIETGRVDEGIRMYEQYAAEHEEGERRGRAFYRLAKVYRVHRVDLPMAKAMLDSVVAVGAARDVVDSARVMQNELTRGLIALGRVQMLQDSLRNLEAQWIILQQQKAGYSPYDAQQGASLSDSISLPADSVGVADSTSQAVTPPVDVVPERVVAGDTLAADSLTLIHDSVIDTLTSVSTRSDTTSTRDTLTAKAAAIDSATSVVDSIVAPAPRAKSPAALAADSLLRALQQQIRAGSDTVASAEAAEDSLRVAQPPVVQSPAPSKSHEETELAEVERLRREYHKELQLALLHVAEFYEFSLMEHDSAMAYYRRAAASPSNPDVYWRANLYLAYEAQRDTTRMSEAQSYFQVVANADSVPVEARNVAHEALGLALIVIPASAQSEAFRMVEQVSLSNQVPMDSVIRLYSNVIAFDSTSPEAMHSLFAQVYLYEHVLLLPDSARAVMERIVALYPDSSFTNRLKIRLQPPDSSSIFLLSDEELTATVEPQESVIEEIPTEGGWPPPEESLRGRRFE